MYKYVAFLNKLIVTRFDVVAFCVWMLAKPQTANSVDGTVMMTLPAVQLINTKMTLCES